MKIPIIRYYPDDKESPLRRKCLKVKEITDGIKSFCENVLIETMLEYSGAGLAAPQIGSNARIIAVTSPDGPIALINPVILEHSKVKELNQESCLSIPDKSGLVLRYKYVIVQFQTVNGLKIKTKLIDYPSFIIQHEIDHLDGVLYIDRLSFNKK
jgi:peptide deformylase